MTETTHLNLPLLQAAQAQKHVTLNEALEMLDGLVQLVLQSQSQMGPTGSEIDGEAYFVPAGATGLFAGQEGRIALRLNGGWYFVPVRTGWRAYIADEAVMAEFDGVLWRAASGVVSPAGAATNARILEFDHVIGVGATSVTTGLIPQYALVQAVTARVTQTITGAATAWKLGVAGADNRYASGMGTAAGTWLIGPTGAPTAYYADTPLVLTAEGGDFAGGTVRIAVHYQEFTPPAA